MDDAVRLCPGEGVTEHFRELVDDVAGQQRLGLDPMTSYYVVQLLATFARTDAAACDAFWADQPMGAFPRRGHHGRRIRAAPAAAQGR